MQQVSLQKGADASSRESNQQFPLWKPGDRSGDGSSSYERFGMRLISPGEKLGESLVCIRAIAIFIYRRGKVSFVILLLDLAFAWLAVTAHADATDEPATHSSANPARPSDRRC